MDSHCAAPRDQHQLLASDMVKGADKRNNLIYIVFVMVGEIEGWGEHTDLTQKGPAPARKKTQDLHAVKPQSYQSGIKWKYQKCLNIVHQYSTSFHWSQNVLLHCS